MFKFEENVVPTKRAHVHQLAYFSQCFFFKKKMFTVLHAKQYTLFYIVCLNLVCLASEMKETIHLKVFCHKGSSSKNDHVWL